MSETHDHNLNLWTKKFPPRTLWYLEVIVSDPDARGCGVGGALMRWTLEQLGDMPCFLECTDKSNVQFYERYGFSLVGTTELVDAKDERGTVSLYWMIRDPKK